MSLNFFAFLYISLHFSAFLYISLHFSAFLCISLHFSVFHWNSLHASAFIYISLHFSTFLKQFSAFLWISYAFLCVSLLFSAFLCISLHFFAFLCISLDSIAVSLFTIFHYYHYHHYYSPLFTIFTVNHYYHCYSVLQLFGAYRHPMDAMFVVVVVVVVVVSCPWPPLTFWTNPTPLYMQCPYSNFSPLSNPRSFTCYLSKSGLKSGALHLGIGAFHKTTAHWFEINLKKYIYFTEMKQIWHKQHTSQALTSVEQHFPSWGQETAARRGAWADGLYLLLASVAGQGSTQHLHLPHSNLVCIPPPMRVIWALVW